jgi:peptidoglycan-associated lipoprotein
MAEIQAERSKTVPGWVWALVGLAGVGLIALALGLTRGGPEERAVSQTAGAPAGCTRDDDCAARQLCASGNCRDIQVGAAECAEARVQFGTDSAAIRAEDQGRIGRMARCLKADESLRLTIAGAADERGTAEHTAELGERRARAVARALAGLGVSPGQLKVVSYGDNYSLCDEADAACWAKNR